MRIIMNDGLSTIPPHCLDDCIEVTGAYSAQSKEINISLTAIGLLWTATDFIAKGLGEISDIDSIAEQNYSSGICEDVQDIRTTEVNEPVHMKKLIDYKMLLFSVFTILRNLAADERPEVYCFPYK
ncbi:hypothetical protein ZIOFF_041179 [Zingiber officinale]|uniref:Mon2 C-terminal domain-containing protein n=1 Tax=Zingiber officinale TaxID=94328 RepID=A0A8J5G679_ZINOF|nr:hypothetical protein ZIOFF_041179 [Zingiber officinale]